MGREITRRTGDRRGWAIFVTVLLWAVVAAGDPREVHKLGLEALDGRRWADAERFFRAAIAERGEEKVNPLFGRRYLPHYYLGIAVAEQGDCRAARTAWRESASQGKIQKIKELADDLERRDAACQSRLRRLDAARDEIEGLLEQAEGSLRELSSFATKPALAAAWARGEGSFAARLSSAEERLGQAELQLARGFENQDLDRLSTVRGLVESVLADSRSAIDDARQELGERRAAVADAQQQLEESQATARAFVRSISDLAPYPAGLVRRVAAVERILGSIEQRKDGAQPGELETLRTELEKVLGSLQYAARRPPRRLAEAVEAFLGGRYEEVLELLTEQSYRDQRSRVQVCVLRSASRHALWALGGEAPELADEIRSEAFECHQLGAVPELGPRYFSPRFLEFFAAAATPPPAPEAAAGEAAAGEAAEAETGPVESGDSPATEEGEDAP